MTKQEVLTALKCCISHEGYSKCSECPYNREFSEDNPFRCSYLLYLDTVKLLGGDAFVTIDLDKAIQDGK